MVSFIRYPPGALTFLLALCSTADSLFPSTVASERYGGCHEPLVSVAALTEMLYRYMVFGRGPGSQEVPTQQHHTEVDVSATQYGSSSDVDFLEDLSHVL